MDVFGAQKSCISCLNWGEEGRQFGQNAKEQQFLLRDNVPE